MGARLLRAAALLIGCLLMLTACAPTLPLDGEVNSAEVPERAEPNFGPDPQPPEPGATPEQIIRDFLRAGANAAGDHAVAREYLTEDFANEWDPRSQTLVYSGDNMSIDPAGEYIYNVQVNVDSRVEADGSIRQSGDPTSESFEVEEVDGEYRISSAPDAKILDEMSFNSVYSEFTLYFFDPQYRYAVPDARWLPRVPGQSTELVNRLLDGPVSWLAPGVTSAFGEPEESNGGLGASAVTVEGGTATVDVDTSVTAGASDDELALMYYQLEMLLDQLNTINSVELTAGGSSVEIPDSELVAQIEQDPEALQRQIGVQGDQLIWQLSTDTSMVPGMPDLSAISPRFPAVSTQAEGEVVAVMNGDLNALYHVRTDSPGPELLVESENMTRPSMDNFGWTWTVTHDQDGEPTIRAFNYEDPESGSVTVTADFIEEREVTSLRISQDGSRAAIVVDDAGLRSLYITPVQREPSTGVPWSLGQNYQLHPDEQVELEEVRWSGNDEVFVWSPYDPDADEHELRYMQRINISSRAQQPLDPVSGLTNVSVGEERDSVYVEQAERGIFQWVGGSLNEQEIDDDVRDLSYSG